MLTTIRRDGRPQLSNIVYAVADDDTIRISVTAGRAKTKNLTRDPRASLYVCRENFWAYAVVDGTAEVTPVAQDPNDATVDELVALYRSLAGEHDDWDDYRAATGRRGADRDDFADSSDFIGWYMNGAARVNGVPLHDAYNQYLAYHEGKAGFARGSYRKKAWLPPVARDVEAWATLYEKQLQSCPVR